MKNKHPTKPHTFAHADKGSGPRVDALYAHFFA